MENMHEVPNKPWSANGLLVDTLIRKIDDIGVQTILMVVVGLNHLLARKLTTKQL